MTAMLMGGQRVSVWDLNVLAKRSWALPWVLPLADVRNEGLKWQDLEKGSLTQDLLSDARHRLRGVYHIWPC